MMMSSNDVDHHKVPIWIGTDCKLVSGINKSTTCQNVIQSLVRTENPSKFVIVEKWKKMERRLDPNVRILKVWKAWGDQKDDVALILRHHHSTDGYIDKRISNKVLRRNKSSQHHKLTNHDENMEEVEVTEPMERLLKLVLTQGETIQVQLKKLRHQEEQIERYEEQMHKMRSLQEGENYVVDSYLLDDKGKKPSRNKRDKSPRKSGWLKQQQHNHSHQQPSSTRHHNHPRSSQQKDGGGNGGGEKAAAAGPSSSSSNNPQVQMKPDLEEKVAEDEENIHEKSEIMERICDLNGKLTKEEEHLVKLGLKIKKYYERYKGGSTTGTGNGPVSGSGGSNNASKSSSSEDRPGLPSPKEAVEEGPLPTRPEDDEDMREMMSQLEALRDITGEQLSEIELNEKSLNEIEQMLDSKHDHVSHLTYQIQLVDEESEHLRQRLLKISQGFPPHPHHYPYDNQFPAHLGPMLTTAPATPAPFTSSQGQLAPFKPPLPTHITNSAAAASAAAAAAAAAANNSSSHPSSAVVALSSCPMTAAAAPVGLGPASVSEMNKKMSHSNPSKISSSNCNSNSKNNPSSLPVVETAAAISFGCQHSESIPATQLNLHIKPCRDHQDNDSNSDTGISSLHSSSDENTLFVLDTLV